jgi:hypothetical protein
MRWLLVLLAGCDACVDIPIKGEADYGQVYICERVDCPYEDSYGFELCWDGSQAELEEILGTTCAKIGFFDRAYPAIVGCAYGCPLEGAGCNAHCGCFCP